MSRAQQPSKRKKLAAMRQQPVTPRAPRPGVETLDLATEKEINGIFVTYLKRMGLTLAIMAISAAVVVGFAHVSKSIAGPVVFLAVSLGLMLSYRRGIEQVFTKIKELGLERLRAKRYADAIFALEQFHRVGNMSYDRDGEAHYQLLVAYLGLNQIHRAIEMADWLARHRARGPYAERAAAAVKTHRNTAPADQTSSGETG